MKRIKILTITALLANSQINFATQKKQTTFSLRKFFTLLALTALNPFEALALKTDQYKDIPNLRRAKREDQYKDQTPVVRLKKPDQYKDQTPALRQNKFDQYKEAVNAVRKLRGRVS